MAQCVWHSLPIWVSSSSTPPEVVKRVPRGRCLRSKPSTMRFSPKAPSSTSAPRSLKSSMASKPKRLTWRCHLPAWASSAMPQSSLSSTLAWGDFWMPLRSLVHTAWMVPICDCSPVFSLPQFPAGSRLPAMIAQSPSCIEHPAAILCPVGRFWYEGVRRVPAAMGYTCRVCVTPDNKARSRCWTRDLRGASRKAVVLWTGTPAGSADGWPWRGPRSWRRGRSHAPRLPAPTRPRRRRGTRRSRSSRLPTPRGQAARRWWTQARWRPCRLRRAPRLRRPTCPRARTRARAWTAWAPPRSAPARRRARSLPLP